MRGTPEDLLKSRVKSVLRVLGNTERSTKTDNITVTLANEFNRLLSDAASILPDASEHFPHPIPCSSENRSLGIADASYLELELYCEQLLDLISQS